MNFGADSRAQVLDMTLYDDQLLATLVAMNVAGEKHMPVLAYTGVAWGPLASGLVRVANLQEAATDILMTVARSETPLLHMRGVRLPAKPVLSASQKPSYQQEDYIVSCPVAAGQLAIRQTYYDKWGGNSTMKTTGGLTWADIVQAHNQQFNVSGVPYKSKRLAEENLESLQSSSHPAIKLPPAEGDQPQTLEDLLKTKCIKVISSHPALYSLYVTEDGACWIHGEAEGTVSSDDCLFPLRGQTKMGPVATKLMKDSKSWVEYKMCGSDVVTLGTATPLKQPYTTGPRPLNAALHFLEQQGFVRVQIHLHTASRDPAAPGQYIITATDAGAWDIGTETTLPSKDITTLQIAGHINVPDLKACAQLRIVPRLQFSPSTNKILAGYPGVFFKDSIQIEKGMLARLF